MIISISGSPGTGKSEVAKLLAKKMDANLLSIKTLIKGMKCSYDKQRKTKIVDIKELQRIVDKKLEKTNIIEGHLAHLLKSDIIIILRTNPAILKRRLSKRNWSKKKIEENIQAEILDSIPIEALQRHNRSKIFELDTSKKTTAAVVAAIAKILNKHGRRKYSLGKIDWSERYKDELLGV